VNLMRFMIVIALLIICSCVMFLWGLFGILIFLPTPEQLFFPILIACFGAVFLSGTIIIALLHRGESSWT
jgi:hypothetical protein